MQLSTGGLTLMLHKKAKIVDGTRSWSNCQVVYSNLCIYLATYEYRIPLTAAPLMLYRMGQRHYCGSCLDTELIIVPFLLERREPHGVSSPCGHRCMVCATVCLTVMPSFSYITDVSIIGHRFKTDISRTPLFHVAQYGDDSIGRELNLRNTRKYKNSHRGPWYITKALRFQIWTWNEIQGRRWFRVEFDCLQSSFNNMFI